MGTEDPSEFPILTCTPKFLPRDDWHRADQIAAGINPENHSPDAHLVSSDGANERLVVSRRVYWGGDGVHLTVGFLDNPPADLCARILAHMNAWSKTANVTFRQSNTDPHVRIARARGNGHWSYLGTDIHLVPENRPTMNLDGFTMNTPDSEFYRVVRHETGHTLGFPHEHMRKELIDRLDRDKVIASFMKSQVWSEQEVVNQVLTPLEESSVFGSPSADGNSIMCYQIEGELTKDGQPIIGGLDIAEIDYQVAAALYPKTS